MSADSGGPLSGTTVLELGSLIAGPFAGQLLGDYGADVIKVEPLGAGDPMRHWGVQHEGDGLWWPTIGRNKRSICIDVRKAAGQDLIRRLAAKVDILTENFRPGRMAEWGLGYDALSAVNPALIVAHVSGFGQTGPRSGDAGFGIGPFEQRALSGKAGKRDTRGTAIGVHRCPGNDRADRTGSRHVLALQHENDRTFGAHITIRPIGERPAGTGWREHRRSREADERRRRQQHVDTADDRRVDSPAAQVRNGAINGDQ